MKAYALELLMFAVALAAHLTGRRSAFWIVSIALASMWLKAERNRLAREAMLRELREITLLLRRAWLVWR